MTYNWTVTSFGYRFGGQDFLRDNSNQVGVSWRTRDHGSPLCRAGYEISLNTHQVAKSCFLMRFLFVFIVGFECGGFINQLR